ncbi:unnamed protein product [Parajaminaea phylloscopi]
MPLSLPVTLDVRPAPSAIRSVGAGKSLKQEACALCHENTASYTCPNCNSPYCSLKCFKDPKRHGGCVSAFAQRNDNEARKATRQEHDDQWSSNDAASQEQRRKVLDLLRQWQLGGDDLDLNDATALEEDAGSEVSETLSERSIDARAEDLPSDVSDLLALLSPEQRQTFLDAVEATPQASQGGRAARLWEKVTESSKQRAAGSDPNVHANKQPRQAESAVTMPQPATKLWWTGARTCTSALRQRRSGYVADVNALLGTQTDGNIDKLRKQLPGVSWNCAAVLVAYVYILLHLDASELTFAEEEPETLPIALALLQRLVPILFTTSGADKDAKVLLQSPSAVTAYILSNLGEQDRSPRPGQMVLALYREVYELLSDPRDTQRVIDLTEHCEHNFAIDALGDVWALLAKAGASCTASRQRQQLKMAQRKLAFYGAHILRLQRARLLQAMLGVYPPRQDHDGPHSPALSAGGQQWRNPALLPSESSNTLSTEMVRLEDEVNALEDEERQRAAWRLDCQRLGLDDTGNKPVARRPHIAAHEPDHEGRQASPASGRVGTGPEEEKPVVSAAGAAPDVAVTTKSVPRSFAHQRSLRQAREREQLPAAKLFGKGQGQRELDGTEP